MDPLFLRILEVEVSMTGCRLSLFRRLLWLSGPEAKVGTEKDRHTRNRSENRRYSESKE